MALLTILAALLALSLSGVVDANARCNPGLFSDLTLENIQIMSFQVAPQRNVRIQVAAEEVGTLARISESDIIAKGREHTVEYCNISMVYTHPGQRDYIFMTIALPMHEDSWNKRFLMTGGGGYTAGSSTKVLQPVAAGFATASTNAGHWPGEPTRLWGLTSEGNVNWPLLHDFASQAMWEAATLGQMATKWYYREKIGYSYFVGCSTGGRQGYMFAQRYPAMFDGIMAGCPAINWHKLLPAMLWPIVIANELSEYRTRVSEWLVLTSSQISSLPRACWTRLQRRQSPRVISTTEPTTASLPSPTGAISIRTAWSAIGSNARSLT